MTPVELFIPWKDIHADAKILSAKLSDRRWNGVVAVTRGGMVPACLVARELDIKTIETYCISTYSYQSQDREEIPKALSLPDGGAGWLVIDDLVDSGKTYEIIRKTLPRATYACLYAKPAGAAQSDVFVKEFPQNTWIHCPWEVDADTGAPQGR